MKPTEDGMAEKLTSVEKSASGLADGSACVGACLKGRANKGRPYRSLCQKQQAKATAFWNRINAKRKEPGHCARCGRPHSGPLRQCDECREYHRKHRAAKAVKPLMLTEVRPALTALKRRIASLEIAVARLQLDGRNAYRRGWDSGFRKGRGQRARNYEGLRGEHSAFMAGCRASKEELKTLHHAYGGEQK